MIVVGSGQTNASPHKSTSPIEKTNMFQIKKKIIFSIHVPDLNNSNQ